MQIPLLGEDISFPDVRLALDDPNGLLAVGGDLSPQRLINAYRQGIFPWFDEEDPILWWSPSPRSVLIPNDIRISRSTKKAIKHSNWQFSVDQAFHEVIAACADQRIEQGTWISEEMIEAYCQLHELGYAHSMEVWNGTTLVGGLYGVHIGHAFFGESMFHRESNASKAATLLLQTMALEHQIELIDCQLQSQHLDSLGAKLIDRQDFSLQLATLCYKPHEKDWCLPLHCKHAALEQNHEARQKRHDI